MLCSDYVADLIKKLELYLTVVSVLLKIRLGHVQINMPKISIPLSKTVCINPCLVGQKRIVKIKGNEYRRKISIKNFSICKGRNDLELQDKAFLKKQATPNPFVKMN